MSTNRRQVEAREYVVRWRCGLGETDARIAWLMSCTRRLVAQIRRHLDLSPNAMRSVREAARMYWGALYPVKVIRPAMLLRGLMKAANLSLAAALVAALKGIKGDDVRADLIEARIVSAALEIAEGKL